MKYPTQAELLEAKKKIERLRRIILALIEKLPSDEKRTMLAAFGDLDDMEAALDIKEKP
jgi:hypothetical protein